MLAVAAVGVLSTLAGAACSPVASEAPVTAPATAPAARQAQSFGDASSPPAWRLGDRWVFDWTSGNDSGSKSVEVLQTNVVGGVQYYVVRTGDAEHYYTPELHWAFAVHDAKVQARMIPPQPWFVWPLEPGRTWQHRGSFEDGRGRVSQLDTFRAVGVETVEVPAGHFRALKIVRTGERGDSDEYWYAPDVHWYVRWVGRRGDVSFEERLRSYDPVSRRPRGETPPVPHPVPAR